MFSMRSSIQIVPKIEKAQPVGHAFYFTLYIKYQIGEGKPTNSGNLYLERFHRVRRIGVFLAH